MSQDKPKSVEIAEIVKSIMKLIKGIFNRNGDYGGDYEQGLRDFRDEISERLTNTAGNNELKAWANENSSAFLTKIADFVSENKSEIQQLVDEKKFSDIHDLVLHGVAKDLAMSFEVSDMPANVESNPNRRDPAVIADALDSTTSMLQDSTIEGARDLSQHIEKFVKDHLSSSPVSGYEKDTGKRFDKTNDRKLNKEQDYDNDPSLEA